MNDRATIYGWLTVAAALWGGAATAETRVSADVGAEAGYASNPFAAAASSVGTAMATLNFSPTVSLNSATSQLSLSGRLTHIEYSDRYNSNTNYHVNGRFTKSLSPVSSASANASYSSVIANAFGGVSTDPSPGDPDTDPTLVESVGRRMNTVRGGANFSTSLSPRDTLQFDVSAYRLRVERIGLFGNNLDNYSGTAAYSHAFSRSVTLGTSIGFSRTNFRDSLLENATVYSPSLTAEIRLAPRVRLTGNAGVSFSDTRQFGLSFKQTNFSGSARICHDGDRLSLCATARRAVNSTSVQGLTKITGVGATASYRLSPRSAIIGRFDYARTSAISFGTPLLLGYHSVSARYSREMTRRLSLHAEGGYTGYDNATVNRNSNIIAKVGVSYRLGRTQ